MAKPLNIPTAYILWALCFFGVAGGQRFYTGQIFLGIVYFCTWGLFGIGQFIDIFLIPDMVERRNVYLRGLSMGDPRFSVQPGITLTLNSDQFSVGKATTTPAPSPMQRLLRAAQKHDGILSVAQAVMYTELEPEEVRALLQEAERNGLAEITNDPITGAIRYQFDL